jgi:UDP-N-acetylmuramoyl-L-alanyl-D-glutamate--2,6-diaminopimelate ligase
LKTIKKLRTGNEEVITVVGCGGDRDKTKRPEMAKIAAQLSNRLVLTSDNPRTEIPEEIIKDMATGLDPVSLAKTLQITDRKEAIKLACTLAKPNDIILIAGKGHEKYQDINGVKHPFDDLETVEQTFKLLQK